MTATTYARPSFLVARVGNPLISTAARLGLSLRGAHVLETRGRKTGQWRATPVNPVTVDGVRYLVAPRGDTHWVRNLRAAGEARLQLGRKSEAIRVQEVEDSLKSAVLREYLSRWYAETGKLFGVPKDASDEDLARIAPNHPVFRIIQ